MSLLPRHVQTMRNWLDLVEELVVVDSESTDGTPEFLRQELTGPRVRFFDHPRGLYQSWNFGIRQIRSRYTYIATVGDEMTREGFRHLAEVVEQLDCDVVVSKPNFVDESNQPVVVSHWPIDRMIESLGITEPVVLKGWIVFLFALVSCPDAVLGSSASNLYRTACLQERPFPTGFGTVGDGAWGMANALQIRLGVTPRRLSMFREHAKTYPLSEYVVDELPAKLRQLGRESLHEMIQASSQLRIEAKELGVEDMLRSVEAGHHWYQELVRQRRRPCPWVFNPAAWRARHRRGRYEQESAQILEAALERLAILGDRTGRSTA